MLELFIFFYELEESKDHYQWLQFSVAVELKHSFKHAIKISKFARCRIQSESVLMEHNANVLAMTNQTPLVGHCGTL